MKFHLFRSTIVVTLIILVSPCRIYSQNSNHLSSQRGGAPAKVRSTAAQPLNENRVFKQSFSVLKAGPCDHVESYSPIVAIPDNDTSGVYDTQTISAAPGTVLGVDVWVTEVCVDITHTWVGDLMVKLIAPNGVEVVLIDRPGVPATGFGCGNPDISACFEMGTGNDAENECNPTSPAVSGIFTAHDGDDIDAINAGGGSPNGTWQLFVSDAVANDTGTLDSWSVNFYTGPTAFWNPPAEICESASPIDLNLLVTGTAGGTFSGSGVSSNNFDPAGLSGLVDITYVVSDSLGCSDTSTQSVLVVPGPPAASFTFVPLGSTVNFSNTSTSVGMNTYSWDFGDTNSSTDENPVHVYATGGTYLVSLTATNICGSDVFTDSVTVSSCGDQIVDGGLEAGPGGGAWIEFSTNFSTPICDVASCGTGTGTGPASGNFWAWFGGAGATFEEGSLSQTVTLPLGTAELSFVLEQIVCDSPDDFMNIAIDSDTVFTTDGSSSLCGQLGYTPQSVNLDAYADGAPHTITFFSRTYGLNGASTNFFVDDIILLSCPVGVDEYLLEKNISIAPNPAADEFRIIFDDIRSDDRVRFEIYDVVGRTIHTSDDFKVSGSHTEQVDVSNWRSGLYFVRVTVDDHSINKRLVVR